MEEPGTDTLRKLAPCWTLAGDERLLTILQNTHQKLVAKCQEANSQLEQMATALDDASITLQNVNNQFMALSSSQFIESRVYDDDADVTTDNPTVKVNEKCQMRRQLICLQPDSLTEQTGAEPKERTGKKLRPLFSIARYESPKPSPPDELSILKRSIAVIENTHEVITILHDSDTESDTDDDLPDRLVMKPKDLYADRPLPYIIGSEPWKNKWHAGLLPEDSDTDSTTSKVLPDSDQYSQSEPEEFDSEHPGKVQETSSMVQHIRNLSETSSELPSEATPNTRPNMTPSDVASEIARRLGAGHPPPKMMDDEPVYEEPSIPAVRKIYKPQEPVTSTIFPDEPPPLDAQSEDDGDIFAELHRHQPYNQPYARQYVTDDLFGDDTENDDAGDIFSDFANQPSNVKPTSLFDAGPTPHMFDKQQISASTGHQTDNVEQPVKIAERTPNTISHDEERIKKPIGGISLFGSNKGAESIGAAILKRNQRKSSTSGEESGNDVTEPPPLIKEQAKKEKDIFDDLFAKNESKKVKPKVDNIANDIKQHIEKKSEEKVKKDIPKAVDLFSDNLFDDIDDIFTTNIVKTSKDNKKSIFEDEDDLFSDIAEPKTVKHENQTSIDVKKSLFDSDDDLFAENIAKAKPNVSDKSDKTKLSGNSPKVNENSTKSTETTNFKETTSIFDDDDDNIFSNTKTNKLNNLTEVQNVTTSNRDNNIIKNVETSKNMFKSSSLFDDDDDDENDLFANTVKSPTIIPKNESINKVSTETPAKTETEASKKTKLIITEGKDETNINNKVLQTDKDLNGISNNIEASIEGSIDNNTSIKSDESINEQNDFVETDTKIIENNLNNDVPNIEQNFESIPNIIPELLKEQLENNNLSSNTKSITIDKMLEDNNDKISDDDFSEQDFDDEPNQAPKSYQNSTSNVPELIPNETTNTHSIFDNIGIEEEDIFALPNIPTIHKEEITNTDKTKIDENTEIIPKSNIFTDIITEPPAFEKPKEPKRSKNVNALFDDDSDDETLFFKKEDVITDEKPEDFTIKQDRLFGLFTDEPPDEDLDDNLFSTLPKPKIPDHKIPKSNVESNFDELMNDVSVVNEEIRNITTITETQEAVQESPELPEIKAVFKIPSIDTTLPIKSLGSKDANDIFKQPQSLIEQKTNVLDDDDDELFKSLPVQLPTQETDITKHEESDEQLFKSLPLFEKIEKPAKELPKEIPSIKSDVKKVGKLKLGLNINVNALLPGSSPKKVKLVDSPDGQTPSAEIKKDDTINTVSFDSKPGSEILDNKLSKERPRIQVKRRPSTRKARIEAVRKSGIDFGDDSTDNSSSFDEPPRAQATNTQTTDITDKNELNNEEINKIIDPKDTKCSDVNPLDRPAHPDNLAKNVHEHDNINFETNKPPVKSESTTKIVYILNDEDIFNTNVLEKPEVKNEAKNNDEFGSNSTKNVENNSTVTKNNEKDLNAAKNTDVSPSNAEVTSTITKNIETDSNLVISDVISSSKQDLGIKTLGKAYQTDKKELKTTSLFGGGDLSEDDDELFKNKKPIAKVNIFNSDSDEELFGTAKKVEKVIKEEKKGSLFGDDDDDDDLFGVKTKKSIDPQPQPSRATSSIRETSKPAEPVFEDPLSMFGDDD